MIMNKYLNKEQRLELITRHKLERDKRVADRIKTILLLDDGYSRHETLKDSFFARGYRIRICESLSARIKT